MSAPARRLALAVLAVCCLVPSAASGARGHAEVRLGYDVLELSADGARVAINRGLLDCDGVSIWNPVSGANTSVRPTGFCEGSGTSAAARLAVLKRQD